MHLPSIQLLKKYITILDELENVVSRAKLNAANNCTSAKTLNAGIYFIVNTDSKTVTRQKPVVMK